MAEAGRTVRVSGLPTDIEDDRLKDKLLIHFLRARNGGGEIDQVTIVKPTPLSALITFEDSAVAQRIVQDCRHFLEIDGKKYELNASEHPESLDPDQVILNLTATVDYSRLPGGITALKNLRKRHQDVQINPTSAERCCTLYGPYSKVQAALAQLLCHPGGPEFPETKDPGPAAPSKAWFSQKYKKPQVSEDQRRKPTKQKEHREEEYVPTKGESLSSNRSPAHDGDCWEAPNHTEKAAPRSPTAFVEESSMIVDADVFQYLQKNCKKEYQQILSRYGVEVVNVTNQGLTTLFLHIADTAAAVEEGQDCMRLAKNAISRLYQENESSICRDQLPKIILHPAGGLQRATENLSAKFPKLLLTEDEQNIYFIGSNRDVTEARRSLLMNHKEARDKKEGVASLLNFPSYNSGSSPVRADEERGPLPTPRNEGPLDERIDQMLISEEDDLRADGARRYKLAARFKDSGLSGLGSFPFRPNSSPSRQTRQEPLLGHDTQSETTAISGEEVSRAVAQNTGRDVLFKGAYMSPPSAFAQMKTSLNTDVIDTRPKNLTSPFASTSSSLPQNPPPSGSGSTLKRASSFSGTPQQKAQLLGQKSQDDSSKSTARVRERSSSLSSRTVRDKQEVHREEILVSRVMWQYIKEAYSTRVEDLTSDLQMKESFSEGSREVTVILRGADSSKVTLCRQRLQTLVDSVSADFSVQELRMSELGLSSTEDETLQACYYEVRSRFKKVVIHLMKKSLYVVGPEQLCSQVAATLREVFTREPEQYDVSNLSSLLEAAQSRSRGLDSSYQVGACTQTGKADGNSGSEQWKTTYDRDFGENGLSNGSNSQSELRREFVFKEKQDGKIIEKNAVNGENDRALHGTQTHTTGHRPAETQRTSVESRSGLGGQVSSCACGESKMPVVRTKCGVTMCTACLEKMHLSCKVCHEAPQIPQGVRGEIKKSRLNMSLPGQNKVGVIKITYRIPDGIQGEGHPSPGKPFKGKLFEAYLPDNDEAKKLLPRLEEAFRKGLTFTVIGKGTEARVSWDCIPHKTSLHGGKTEKGYPDSMYLSRLSSILASKGIK
uniref:RING-type E3 ubiquitin transferase n=1 Tax=Fundulus heteroclitus TaxID=8078 RepID=A0A3Q2QMV8_FUNHE